jgi:hypothetical protein
MANDESKAAATADMTAVSSITTRSQKQKAATTAATDTGANSNNATDDNEKHASESNHKKEREPFKGKSDKMAGNVFQLAAEGRKANQFTLTLQALHNLANVEMDNAKDLAPFFEDRCRDAKIEEPDDKPPMLKDGKTRAGRDHRLYIQWKDQCEQYNQRMRDLSNNKVKIFTITLQQCSQSVTNKIEATSGFAKAKASFDCQWLLTTIKNVCHNFEHTDNRLVALVKAKAEIFQYRQGANQSTHDYHDAFNEQLAILESYGGKLHDPIEAAPSKLAAKITALTDADKKDALMRNADHARYEPLREELKNDFTKGRDEYPTSVTAAYQMLLSRDKGTNSHQAGNRRGRNNNGCRNGGRGNGAGGGRTPQGRGKGQEQGHGSQAPPSTVTPGKSFAQATGYSMAQAQTHFPDGIPNHYSDSTVSIFNNAEMLVDIHQVDTPLVLESNGGRHQTTYQMGSIPGFRKVWYNEKSIANILSLAEVQKVRHVTMDSNNDSAFHVHQPDGSGYTRYEEHPSGLYLHDSSKGVVPYNNAADNSDATVRYSYLQTVTENKKLFTKRQIKNADKSRQLYQMLGRPGPDRFMDIVRNNLILNYPVTIDDVTRAQRIYGKDVAFLKGKTTASPAKDYAPDQPPIGLPQDIIDNLGKVTLCCDIFYVLGLPFCLSTSRNIHFLSCRPIADRTRSAIRACIAADIKTYIHGDGEYTQFKNLFPNVHFNICSAEDHMPEIERAIRTVKETVRATIHGLPYHCLPRAMVKILVSMAIRVNNMLPHADGISDTMSPATIITGLPKPDFNTLTLEFGSYVQVDDGTSTNTKSRTLGAIATNPTGNSSGDHFFMSLESGECIHRRSWTTIPISDAAISRVDAIAADEGMPMVDHNNMINKYDPDDIVDDSAYDQNYTPPPSEPADDHAYTSESDDNDDDDNDSFDDSGHNDLYDSVPLANNNANPNTHTTNVPISNTTERVANRAENGENEERGHRESNEREQSRENEEREQPRATATHDSTNEHEKEERDNEQHTNADHGAELQSALRTKHKSLRNKSGKADYSCRYGFAQIEKSIEAAACAIDQLHDFSAGKESLQLPTIQRAMHGLMFTQMSAQKGIKKHGQAAYDALRKEFEQFKVMQVLEPLDAFTLTKEQKSESLRALSVIKEKKGRQTQRPHGSGR